jgi:hypothetical protein
MYRLMVVSAIVLSMTACAYSAYASSGMDRPVSASGSLSSALVNQPILQSGTGIVILQGAGTPTPGLPAGSATPPSMATPTPVRDTAALQVLLQRLVGYSYPGAPGPEAQIYVGRLPDKMPVDLPLPDGSRVIGSIVRGEESLQIVLDAPQPPDRVLDFYRQRLSAAGWSTPDQSGGPSGGFVPSGIPNGITFCQSRQGPALFVSASAEPNQPTDVRLTLNTSKTQGSPCSQQPSGGPATSQVIPRLLAPAGARQTEGGSGGSSTGSSYNSATLVTDQSAVELAAFYGDQLTQAGWTKQESGQSGPVAWSTWMARDKEGTTWKGLFFALDLPGTGPRHFVYVRVDMP